MKNTINDRVSIITIVLNGEKYIEQTINSVLNQKNVNFEYIIIDGGSKDNTLQIVEKYRDRIDIIISEHDDGIYDAINKGIKLANGSLIGIIHCGDYYTPDAVSIAYNEFIKTGADIIYGDITIIDEIENQNHNYIKFANHLKLRRKMSIFHPSSFISHECYDKHGIYDTKYKIAADYDLFLRYFNKGLLFSHINCSLAFFRMGGVSSTQFKTLIKENILIKKHHIGQFEATKFKYKNVLLNIYYSFRKSFTIFLIGKVNYNRIKLFISSH